MSVVPVCGRGEGDEGFAQVGASLLRGTSARRLEVRVRGHWRESIGCAGPAPESGVFEQTIATARPGNRAITTDARFRMSIDDSARWEAGVGTGWVWRQNVPYASSMLGFRGGGRVRWGFELEAVAYNTPWRELVQEFEQGRVVSVIRDETYRRWVFGVSGSFVVEVPTG